MTIFSASVKRQGGQKLSRISNIVFTTTTSGDVYLQWHLTQTRRADLLYNVTVVDRSGSVLLSDVLISHRQLQVTSGIGGLSVTAHVTATNAWDWSSASRDLISPFTDIQDLHLFMTHQVLSREGEVVLVQLTWQPNLRWSIDPYGYRLNCWTSGSDLVKNAIVRSSPGIPYTVGYLPQGRTKVFCVIAAIQNETAQGVSQRISKNIKGSLLHFAPPVLVSSKCFFSEMDPFMQLITTSSRELTVGTEGGKFVLRIAGDYGPTAIINSTSFVVKRGQTLEDSLRWIELFSESQQRLVG